MCNSSFASKPSVGKQIIVNKADSRSGEPEHHSCKVLGRGRAVAPVAFARRNAKRLMAGRQRQPNPERS